MPHAPANHVKIELETTDGDGGVQSEPLSVEPLAADRFRIKSLPCFLYELSLDDVVRCTAVSGGRSKLLEVTERSGHSTYRVVNPEGLGENFQGIRPLFAALGCKFERANEELIAIDVPPSADVDAIYELLSDGEESGIWEFEEAHFAGEELRAANSDTSTE